MPGGSGGGIPGNGGCTRPRRRGPHARRVVRSAWYWSGAALADRVRWRGELVFVNSHALVVDSGLIGGRQWSEVQQRRGMLRSALGLSPA